VRRCYHRVLLANSLQQKQKNHRYTKNKVKDFEKLLKGLQKAEKLPRIFSECELSSPLLRNLLKLDCEGGCFPSMSEELQWFVSNVNLTQAAEGKFVPPEGTDEDFDNANATVADVKSELEAYKRDMIGQIPGANSGNFKYVAKQASERAVQTPVGATIRHIRTSRRYIVRGASLLVRSERPYCSFL